MKNKEIILKESHNTDEETLEHCLTAIQAMLDMDDFERAYNYLNGFVSEIIAQTREETIREVEWLFTEKPKRGRPKKIRPGRLIMTKQMLYNSKAILDILNKLKK